MMRRLHTLALFSALASLAVLLIVLLAAIP